MTDAPTPPTPPTTPAAPVTPATNLRRALIASLAVNLAVAGLAVGAFLHGGTDGRTEMVRDLGFGSFDEALRPQDRDVLKQAIRAKSGAVKATRAELATDATAVIATLRTNPFDPSALDAALAGQAAHLSARIKLGNDTLRDFLTSLPAQDRLDFADRLEHHLQHGRDAAPLPPK